MIYPRKVCLFLFLPESLPSSSRFRVNFRLGLLLLTHKATCQTCKQTSTLSSRRSIPTADRPVNASVYNDDNPRY